MSRQVRYEVLAAALDASGMTDPLDLLEALSARGLTAPGYRHLRAEAMHALAARLHRAIQLCEFRDDITVRPDGVFVDVGGVRMEISYTSGYLKSSGAACRNQGEALAAVLAGRGIEVSTMIDIGANFGEIALWFKREFPRARVIAIEPSSLNARVLRTNASAQTFSIEDFEIVRSAVGDRSGTVEIAGTLGPMARVVPDGTPHAERVPCERLDALLDRCGVASADFVKIDIEGSEPLLRQALIALRGRVRSYYIEFSQFAPLAGYRSLAQGLLDAGYDCFGQDGAAPLRDVAAIEGVTRAAFAAGPLAVTNLWFFARA
ncbi:MAG TPA: FkbM family methyltransferase [Burkholderiales bacterium]|nr:FkbM family methyltransferase [Burkholderiales bacterium]